MAKLIKFKYVRNDTPATSDPEVVGYSVKINAPSWPAPQVAAVGLQDLEFGDFRGAPGEEITREVCHVDADGTMSEPHISTHTLPTNVAPQAPGDVLSVSITGEEMSVEPPPPPVEGQVAGTPRRR